MPRPWSRQEREQRRMQAGARSYDAHTLELQKGRAPALLHTQRRAISARFAGWSTSSPTDIEIGQQVSTLLRRIPYKRGENKLDFKCSDHGRSLRCTTSAHQTSDNTDSPFASRLALMPRSASLTPTKGCRLTAHNARDNSTLLTQSDLLTASSRSTQCPRRTRSLGLRRSCGVAHTAAICRGRVPRSSRGA